MVLVLELIEALARGGRGSIGTHPRNRTVHSAGTCLDTVTGSWVRKKSSSLCCNYEHTPGPTSSFGPSSSALSFFFEFFTDEVWEMLKTETNRKLKVLSLFPHTLSCFCKGSKGFHWNHGYFEVTSLRNVLVKPAFSDCHSRDSKYHDQGEISADF